VGYPAPILQYSEEGIINPIPVFEQHDATIIEKWINVLRKNWTFSV
jgi:hypothetical protein